MTGIQGGCWVMSQAVSGSGARVDSWGGEIPAEGDYPEGPFWDECLQFRRDSDKLLLAMPVVRLTQRKTKCGIINGEA